MMNPESKPSLEELLRLKRAERPASSFWEEFDRELRAKQLAALVEKRPWWRTLPRRLRGMARYQLPLGATAVLAVTLLSIRDYQAVQPSESSISGMNGEPTMASAGVVPTREAQRLLPPERPVAEVAVHTATVAAKPALSSEATVPGELTRMVPMLSVGDGAAPAEMAPSARSIAENRAVAEALLGTTAPTFETRAIPVRALPPEPLAQMSNPSDTRRSRFAMAFAAAAEAAPTSSAPTVRVARRLSDEQLYDTIRRFGASGNSVSFKF